MRRSCPECGEGILWFGDLLRGSTQQTSRCGHCGAEFRLHRGIVHYLLIAIITIAALLLFVAIAEFEGHIIIKSVLGLVIIFATIALIRRIASLRLVTSGLSGNRLSLHYSENLSEESKEKI